jgi:nucleoside-diphosphate-sugar epimerase
MQILVTGSSGFCGRRLVRTLAEQPEVERVLAVDRVPSRDHHPKISALQIDLTDWKALALLRELRPDVVVHTAADQSSRYLQSVNTVVTDNLIDYCVERGVPRFLFFSSLYASLRCDNYYRYGKLQSEHSLRRSGLRYTILRPDTIYGYGEPKYVTLQRALSRGLVPVIGSGRYRRTPCYVWDLVTIIQRLIADDRFSGEIFELGSATSLTMNEMIALMARELGVRHYVRVTVPAAVCLVGFTLTGGADPDQMRTIGADRIADPSAIQAALGMRLIDFAEGVRFLCHGDERWPL